MRLLRLSKEPTLGVLLVNGLPEFVTLELPWRNNIRELSCIPVGSYACKRRSASLMITAGLGETFEVLDVPNRSDILIHVGNTVKDLRGCIAVGAAYGGFDSYKGVANSRAAFKRLMEMLEGKDEISLEIVDVGS